MKTLPTPALKRRIESLLTRYDLGEVREISLLEGGMFLKPALIETRSGKYVLRAHGFRNTEARFRFQAEAIDAAVRQGVFCARIVRDRSARVGVEENGVFWALHQYLEGHCYNWVDWYRRKRDEPAFLPDLGAGVARMHDALRRAEPKGDASFPLELPPIQFDVLDRIRAHWQEHLEALAREPEVQAEASRQTLLRLSKRIDTHWDRLAENARELKVSELPKQIVHGDVSMVNLVFQDERQGIAFIDWDCLHLGHRLYDAIGDVLHRLPVENPEWNRFDQDEVRAYLEGYAAATDMPISEGEMACVPAFCLARQLEDLRQRLSILRELPAEKDEEYAKLIGMRVEMMDQIEMGSWIN